MLPAIILNASELYLSHRALIERTAAAICRRNHVSAADAEDFVSATHLHLIDQDYAVLRAYQGRAEIGAFLHAVIRRLFQDWRNAQWGRWRPSAAVCRLGPVAMQLETLLVRDQRPLQEAIEVLHTNHGVAETSAQLMALAATFPPRAMRRFAAIDDVPEPADESGDEYATAAATVERRESQVAAAHVSRSLDEVLRGLGAQDQLILKMRFENGAAISTISRVLGLEQQPLYRRVDRLLAAVRASLERAGVDAAVAREVVDRRGLDLLERRPS